MIRRRSSPWIHRKSRLLIAAIATCGAVITAYLTVAKLTGNSALCPTSGCDQVLSSPYASIFGLPLTLFGFLAYAGMAVAAVIPLVVNAAEQKELRSQLENWTWLFLLAGGTAMTVFSAYLMYLLAFKIQAVCLYCLASAIFSLSLLTLTLVGREWEDLGQVFFIGLIVGMITLIGTLAVYANINSPRVDQQNPFAITTASGSAELALMSHLKDVGAKMYGGYQCPHCHDQKQLFGREALRELNYIECDPRGPNAQTELCQEVGIKGYPTWEIEGKFYPGTRSLEELADLSGYQGSRNFQNSFPGNQ